MLHPQVQVTPGFYPRLCPICPGAGLNLPAATSPRLCSTSVRSVLCFSTAPLDGVEVRASCHPAAPAPVSSISFASSPNDAQPNPSPAYSAIPAPDRTEALNLALSLPNSPMTAPRENARNTQILAYTLNPKRPGAPLPHMSLRPTLPAETSGLYLGYKWRHHCPDATQGAADPHPQGTHRRGVDLEGGAERESVQASPFPTALAPRAGFATCFKCQMFHAGQIG